jgi:serralysin
MIADIAAMQTMYGLSTTTRTGDTVYGFNSTAGGVYDASAYPNVAVTIFDSGGKDTIDYSSSNATQLINLNPETFSNVNGLTGNLAIGRSTIIENAIGGGGTDTLIANNAGNGLAGGAGADTLIGGAGNDLLFGDRQNGFDNATDVDHISGGAGNDFIYSGYGDIVDGGAGFDTVAVSYVGASHGITGDTRDLHQGLSLADGAGSFLNVERFSDIALTAFDDKMVIGDQTDPAVVRSWDGNDYLIGQEVSITMYGGNGDDILVGSTSNDTLYGEAGNDKIMGYLGSDQLWGGAGSDIFYFTELGATDTIGDFQSGTDHIDLSAIDANTSIAGDQAFTFIGSSSFDGHAGEARVYDAGGSTGFVVALDVNGDGLADQMINLGSAKAVAGDFIF